MAKCARYTNLGRALMKLDHVITGRSFYLGCDPFLGIPVFKMLLLSLSFITIPIIAAVTFNINHSTNRISTLYLTYHAHLQILSLPTPLPFPSLPTRHSRPGPNPRNQPNYRFRQLFQRPKTSDLVLHRRRAGRIRWRCYFRNCSRVQRRCHQHHLHL